MGIFAKNENDAPADQAEAPAPKAADPAPEVSDKGADTDAKQEPEPAPITTQLVALDVFVTVHPMPNDQLAGFARWASENHPGAQMSVPEWDEIRKTYFNRPVR